MTVLSFVSLTVNQHDALLEGYCMPDLHLAVRPLQNISGQEEDESGASLNALKHALLCQIAGTVVVPDGATIKLIASRICVSIFSHSPNTEAEPLEFEVYGVCLILPRFLAMARKCKQTHT